MSLLERLRNESESRRRVVVIGLDGTPYSFVRKATANGMMPNLKRLLDQGTLVRMDSTQPDVSSVAWASFMTGTNPAKHGIFGFIDRKPDSYATYIPTGEDLQRKTLWEWLSDHERRVCAIGVPMSYPPRPVNGIMIGCFLSPNVEKAAYPPSLGLELKKMGYRVDTDPWAARESREHFLKDYRETLALRVEMVLRLLKSERWDFFMSHIIETDRLHHFLWGEYAEEHPQYYPAFLDCYGQVDAFLGQLVSAISDDDELIILSDHGSCAIRQEFYLSYWLVQNGYLKFRESPPKSLTDIDPASTAYCLDPGRVYINLRGREPGGSVEPGAAYEKLRDELAAKLADVKDPDSGAMMVYRVFKKEEVYAGPFVERAPDLVIQTNEGYDVKGSLQASALTGRSPLTGMHTFDDAMLYLRGGRRLRDRPAITDVMPTILQLMNVPSPEGLDGRSCLEN